MKTAVLCLLIVALANAVSLSPFTISAEEKNLSTPREIAGMIVDAQPEVMKKAVVHYLNQQINALETKDTPSTLREKLISWFTPENLAQKTEQLNRFMRAKLFVRLEMGKLSQTFKNEIEHNPESYFLTYDMYDLLIDE